MEKMSLIQLWKTWDIRFFMLTSMLIQVLLTILAPYRKCCKKGLFKFTMWFLYLSADSVALYTIGLISKTFRDSPEVSGARNLELLSFWAPFLLLHLGGPDTITALALEDNELWHRHALQLSTQLLVTIAVLTLSFGANNINLLVPTVFMFINGTIKYTEKTCALYFASTDVIRDSLKESPAPDYDDMVKEYRSALDANIPHRFEVKHGPSIQSHLVEIKGDDDCASSSLDWKSVKDTEQMISFAYHLYEMSKGLLADAILSLKDDGQIREFFINKSIEEAFRMMEIELNLFYDVLHTKVLLIGRKLCILRAISFLLVVASTLVFSLQKKSNYSHVEVGITFTLLGGAVILDIYNVIMFAHSDWCIILIFSHSTPKFLKSILKRFLSYFNNFKDRKQKRWSGSIACYNLLKCSFKDYPKCIKIIPVKQLKDVMMDWLYVEELKIEKSTIKFIMKELQEKAKIAADDKETIHEVCSARGNLVLQHDYCLVSEYLLHWTLDVDYDESVLTWHLATDICYWTIPVTQRNETYCKLSKDLSDYMSFLLLRQQSLVSQVVGKSNVRLEDTTQDIRACLREQNIDESLSKENLCECLSNYIMHNEIDHISALTAKAKGSQSVFYEACELAKQLNHLGDAQWEIMSKVWVEMLCYAAFRSSPKPHLAELKNGGELISFVWLLMVHLGLREPIQLQRGLRATKLTIYK